MTPVKLLERRVDVQPICAALELHPELWDRHTARTSPAYSPHHGLSDIWARFADPATMQPDGSHDSIWYPPADVLPVRDIVYPLMADVRGERLGGVLITRIKPGQLCKPHTDPGWHARYYDKFAVQIAAAPEQAFHFKGHTLVTAAGDVFWFDNSHTHWVTNESDTDRITMIVCIKTERN
ncbi:aspartyl/asparaginyl beta-hydroxylase domain-containing protein [Variovorax sp. J22G73]|uniref:aspartyl/asparaginyl beta-hydroxylase domain-containing protein n=1 Tax=unclassified Variovorax TaxID=663243 RepID=UPI002577B262|nr:MULTISPECIES: aspartyl/asparaginyl beta-hydroxylase domain-containing protein [unclassified Variovorax]MDM0007892.1 aspartyl/asparaginyl beta-hydroxylase domain-containing protein [Variovorax sp. J22R203]MDM0100485.1 aspartyl/asparaginyl beta-hydroxylase domain-containing protein [Variovorax sp. J22G73]